MCDYPLHNRVEAHTLSPKFIVLHLHKAGRAHGHAETAIQGGLLNS